MSSEPEFRFRDSSWASISAVDFLCVTAGSRGMRPGSRLRPLWLILSLDDPMNYSRRLYASHVLERPPSRIRRRRLGGGQKAGPTLCHDALDRKLQYFSVLGRALVSIFRP